LERVAKSVADFLRREGPQPIWRIRSHLYGRIRPASVDRVIAAYPDQFLRAESGLISLHDATAPTAEVVDG
jgi:hypothetical protein